MRVLLVLLLLLCTLPAHADTIYVSGFDAVDDDTGTNERDTFDFQQILGNGATDSDVRVQTSVIHDQSNGGEGYWKGGIASSHWAGMVVVSTSEVAYYQPCDNTIINSDSDLSWPCDNTIFPLAVSKLSGGLSVNIDAISGSQRRIMETWESDASAGCSVEVKTDRTIELFYDTVLLASIPFTLAQGSFVGLTLDQINSGGAAQCTLKINGHTAFASLATVYPSVGNLTTMKFGALGKCSGGSKAGEACDTTADCTGGGTCTGGVMTMYFDDFVLDDDYAGFGYVANLVPTGEGDTNTWSGTGCPSSNGDCINDYSYSPYTYNTNVLSTSYKNRQEHYNTTVPSSIAPLPDGANLTGVTSVVIGRTATGAGTRHFLLTFEVDGISVGESDRSRLVEVITYPTEIRPLVQITYPHNQESSNWAYSDVSELGWRIKTAFDYTASRSSYLGALSFSVGIRRVGSAPRDFLQDHNKGDEDGITCVLMAGDSMLGLTGGAICTGNPLYDGEHCTYASYCWWDREPLYRDHPTGGCQDENNELQDEKCTVCSGLGYQYFCNGDTGDPTNPTYTCGNTCNTNPYDVPCVDDSDCPGGACDKNTCSVSDSDCNSGYHCSGNDALCCAVDSDCHALGTCLTDAKGGVCVWSCGDPADGGFCPAGSTFADYFNADLAPDVVVKCPQGGESSAGMLNRFSYLLDGIGTYCSSPILGSGRCRCTSNSQCETTSGGICAGVCVGGSEPWSQCSVASDCAGGGSCNTTSKVCWASDAGMDECHNNNACPSALCDFPNPDYIVIQSSINDTGYWGIYNPECTELGVFGSPTMPCWQGDSPIACVNDSDCQASVHKDSVCIGRRALSTSNRMCSYGAGLFTWDPGTCTIQRWTCRSDAECGDRDIGGTTYNLGGNCSQDDDTDLQHHGGCICSADADCAYFNVLSAFWDGASARSYYCRDGICTRSCTTDAHCGNGNPRSCDTEAGRCRGYCTLPSAAVVCATDSDCSFSQSLAAPLGGSIPFRGYCDTTNKVCTGGSEPGEDCVDDTDCTGGGTCSTTCRCTGPQTCITSAQGPDGSMSGSDGLCTGQYKNFLEYLEDPSHSALANYDAMRAQVEALGEGTPPMLVLFTIQEDNPILNPRNNCGNSMSVDYSQWVSQNLISDPARFPYVLEFRDAFNLLPPFGGASENVMFRDVVHLSIPGSKKIAIARVNPWFAALNTCAKRFCSETWRPCSVDSDCNTGLCQGGSEPGTECEVDSDCAGGGDCNAETCSGFGPIQKPQRYCQLTELPHTWTSTTCDEENPCTDLAYSCAVRPCTCACTGSPLTCTGSANTGETCADADACCAGEFGSSACVDGVCSGACPPPFPDNWKVSDTFETGSVLSSSWTNITGAPDFRITSGDAEAADGDEVLAYWNSTEVGSGTYSCAEMTNGMTSLAGACLTVDPLTGYALCCVVNAGVGWKMNNYLSEAILVDSLKSGSETFANGDFIAITWDGTSGDYQCHKATAAAPTAWTHLGTVLDGNTSPSYYAGIFDFDETGWRIESWEAGKGVLPTDRACGTHTNVVECNVE